MNVFGSSGTRGVANEELTPEFVLRVAKAAGTVWDGDRIAIARDTRLTGKMLVNAAASGLASVGMNVDRLGIVPIPGAQAYAEREEIPTIVITASHNPPQYNGVKLVGSDGVELTLTDLEDIEETLLAEAFETVPWNETGQVREVNGVCQTYIQELLTNVDREAIADANLTVALDPGHGAGSLTSPEFFRALGCRVVTVNGQPDGHFPGRDPEPVSENLEDLSQFVRATDADIGIAHDGDADRAIFFDEAGEYVEGSATLAALAAAELEPSDTVVSAVNVSQRLVDVVTNIGANLELTPIGSTNIITRIEELEAKGKHVPIAGEGNGGILFPAYRLARDGAYTAARFLQLGAEQPVSDLIAPYNGYVNVRRNIHYESTAERDAILDAAANQAHESDVELNTRDGYRLDYGDAWVLARPSGTEPLVRIYAEGRDADRAETLAANMYDALADEKANT
ncbi:phosphoglucosamine mutase [Halomontanus rarus]|uniref:phosphoglucosamine mutase n=1 Tax=Halomontanus rarus TaxID=3034020 RepID=UPI00293BE69D|nr:phosphoglucosamine mutase [Halovivax sp. KZCA124]